MPALVAVSLGAAWVAPARVWLLLVPASFLLAAVQAGLLIERWAGGPSSGFPESSGVSLAVRLGTGIAGLSLAALWSGLFGLLPVAGLLVILLAGAGVVRLLRAGSRCPWRTPSVATLAAGLIAGAAWLIAWLWATTPPIFFDELSYHLIVPQRALETGRWPVLPWVFFTLMPHVSDLLLAWGMGIGAAMERIGGLESAGNLGARAMVWGLWVACSIAAWGLAEVMARPASAPWGPGLVTGALAASPTLWFLATLPFSESCAALGVLTAAVLLAGSLHEPGPRPWLPFGMALGLIAATKLTGVYWVAAGVAAAAAAGWSRADLARAGLIVVASVAPWWGRAWVYTGNPIYPMAYDLLGGRFWSVESQARVMGDMSVRAGDLGLSGLLRLPWDLVQHPERFGSGADVGALAVVAAGLLVLLPLLLRLTGAEVRMRRLGDMAALFTAVAAIGWLSTSTVTRFFAPAFVLGLTVLAGAGLRLPRPAMACVLAGLLAAGLWGTLRFVHLHGLVFSSGDVALGREAPEAYLSRQLDHYAAARFVREQVPTDATLLFIGETRPYYFERNAVAPTAYDTHPLVRWVREAPSADALAGRLRAEGISHVVLNVREFKRLHDSYGLLAFAESGDDASERRLKELPAQLTLLFAKNSVYVFEVPPVRPMAKSTEPAHG